MRFPARSGLGAVLPEVTLPELAGSEKIVIIPSLMRDQGGFAYHQSAATARCRAPLNRRSSHVLQMRPITRPDPVPPLLPVGRQSDFGVQGKRARRGASSSSQARQRSPPAPVLHVAMRRSEAVASLAA